ncbi:toll/interleukin-1 receptor-like protein [Bidens hawaiensis]|uniref:toll/interleukin-1 receptor-like protein n=1 Tax=Bidens hawaiensis TaxID=980011 RepID=UPI00404B3BF3
MFELMEQSSMVVILLCKDYVSTPASLNELVKIMEISKAIEGGGLTVLPVFYDVDPLELRNSDPPVQDMDVSLWSGRTLTRKRFRESKESVKLWRQAIVELTNLQGLMLKLKNIPNW